MNPAVSKAGDDAAHSSAKAGEFVQPAIFPPTQPALLHNGEYSLSEAGSSPPVLEPVELTASAATAEARPQALGEERAPSSWLDRVDSLLEQCGEWFNPILVKECRQALKSRQFVSTFFLMLAACWFWSMLCGARFGPDMAYDAVGGEALYGYCMILSFPLCVIVPFMAFRSLAIEREDKTFELLAITALSPRQIIGGKFASALLQMMLFFSAAVPCFAFSYLLRGIDVATILFVLNYQFLSSMLLTMSALMLATVAKDRFWQMLITVSLIIGLFLCFMFSLPLIYFLIREVRLEQMFSSQEFFIVNLGIITALLSTTVLFYLAAASQVTFASDNRSTALRACACLQFALFIGWVSLLFASLNQGLMSTPLIAERFPLTLAAVLSCSAAYWYLIGIFATGEADQLSPRVKRGLPSTFFGRMFLNWLYPGPGRGYLFATGNFLAVFLLSVVLLLAFVPVWNGPSFNARKAVIVGIYLYGYLLFYLGLGTLILRYLQRWYQGTIFLRVLIHALLLFVGISWPFLFALVLDTRMLYEDSPIMIFNPFWPVVNLLERGNWRGMDGCEWIVLVCGIGVLLCNIRGIVAELRQTRLVLPPRMAEEARAAELKAQPAKLPTNPWDQPD
jgi:hypothetical protein